MRMPPQPSFEQFIPGFLRLLFAENDTVVICGPEPEPSPVELQARREDARLNWWHEPQPRECAIDMLLGGINGLTNVHIGGSAHNGGYRYESRDFLHTRALFLDLDYGTAGHRQASAFATLEDATGYLLTMPVKPSAAWWTGHGVQACYLLSEPYLFPAGGSTSANAYSRYMRVVAALKQLSMSDTASSPERSFRLPLTVNRKWWFKDLVPAVEGQLLWCDEIRVHTFDQIEQACEGYGIEEHIARYRGEAVTAEAAAVWEDPDDEPEDDRCDIPYEALPAELRSRIEDTEGERSDRLFGIVGSLVKLGCSDSSIHAHIDVNRSTFESKFGDRRGGLEREIDRLITKIRDGKYVYGGERAPSLKIVNVPVEVPLSACSELDPDMRAMLARYGKETGARVDDVLLNAVRFHEHMFRSHESGVLESPCGSGKSTWAICHMALNAGRGERFMYVTETVASLYSAAGIIETLCETGVGRVHGFNKQKCKELCGEEHDWRECGADNKHSVCHGCEARGSCHFYNRTEEQKRAVLCVTHEGFIRAVEDGSATLRGVSVIVDEHPGRFSSWRVSLADLRNLVAHSPSDLWLGELFPYSVLSLGDALSQRDIPRAADTFARRNYVFCDETRTSATQTVYDSLRILLARGLQSPDRLHPDAGDLQRAGDTLTELMAAFRPDRNGEAVYACKEVYDPRKKEISYALKRSRFSLENAAAGKKMWVLNASAQLSADEYPENLSVYTCPDLPDRSELLTLYCVRGNPTGTRSEVNGRLSNAAHAFGANSGRNLRALLVTGKKDDVIDELRPFAESRVDNPDDVLHLTRGRTKGTNSAGNCTLVNLAAMPTFTTVDDYALHTAVMLHRTFADKPHVFAWTGEPNMPGGRFVVPAMRQVFALSSLDLIYQTLFRGAVRNGQPMDAIIAVRDPEWIVALLRTVLPNARIGKAIKEQVSDEVIEIRGTSPAHPGVNGVIQIPVHTDWDTDNLIEGLGELVSRQSGESVRKRDIPGILGYAGTWKDSKDMILRLLAPFYREGQNNRYLKRK